ncbi:CTP synthase [Candidatus Woesearchaeota archaeon]|nr:CTP synthase [Candidatus Woesearchaeota archaeon]MCF7900730.1 CTP synthase [Candidatus Woesearchaeota archaeon]MCF8013251.1 CTP synthase [Candidatus Woesearchaeota archaeon]
MPVKKKTKWIVVTGGVISTLGKGIISSSIGNLLDMRGYKVTNIKIDPYINVDAGTMRPTEHGEVFVTWDGGETDQDLGNYERFTDNKISMKNSITTGQIYQEVIRKERNLDYKGKCVEVTVHIPEEVKRRLHDAAKNADADIAIVEVGGVVGDYQNILFLEALRQMHIYGDDVVFVHVSYLPIPATAGEMKSKPTQHSIRALNSLGIQTDFIIGRANNVIDDLRKEKISVICGVRKESVISCPDVDTIYEIPLMFKKQGLDENILKKLHLKPLKLNGKLKAWTSFVKRIKTVSKEINVGIVGKYFETGDYTLEDSYISVIEAIKHAGYYNKVKVNIQWINSSDFEGVHAKKNLNKLKNYDAIIVPGGFGGSGIEGKINAIKYVRIHKIPFLGLCYGLQLAVIEHARNLCGLKDANGVEIDPKTNDPVIDILPEQRKLLEKKQYGASMRLGEYPAILKKDSQVSKLYGGLKKVFERHRHRYEVNPDYLKKLESYGLVFSGMSPDRKLVEYLERKDHPFFIATQSHPEFTSRPLKPNPLFNGLIKAALKK